MPIEQLSFYFLPFYLRWQGKGGLCVQRWRTFPFLLEKTWNQHWEKWHRGRWLLTSSTFQWKSFGWITFASSNLLVLLMQICVIFKIGTMQNVFKKKKTKKHKSNTCTQFNLGFKQICTIALKLAVQLQILPVYWFIDITNSICIMPFLLKPSVSHAHK